MPSYLVVGNQTLDSPDLAEAIRERVAKEPSTFHVVVPATPVSRGLTWDEDEARAAAQERLTATMNRLHAIGLEVTGEVGVRIRSKRPATRCAVGRSTRSSCRRSRRASRAGSVRTCRRSSRARSRCRLPWSRPRSRRCPRARERARVRYMAWGRRRVESPPFSSPSRMRSAPIADAHLARGEPVGTRAESRPLASRRRPVTWPRSSSPQRSTMSKSG